MLVAMAEEFLSERIRAEDIILGSLGFGEDAKITSISATQSGFKGEGVFADGDSFVFENDEELTGIEAWALAVLLKNP
jgi:hypothetical protein